MRYATNCIVVSIVKERTRLPKPSSQGRLRGLVYVYASVGVCACILRRDSEDNDQIRLKINTKNTTNSPEMTVASIYLHALFQGV